MVGYGKLDYPKDRTVLDNVSATSYECTVDFILCTTAIRVQTQAVHIRFLKPGSSYTPAPTSHEDFEHRGDAIT